MSCCVWPLPRPSTPLVWRYFSTIPAQRRAILLFLQAGTVTGWRWKPWRCCSNGPPNPWPGRTAPLPWCSSSGTWRWRLDQQLHVALRHQIGTAVPALGWLFNRPDVPWGGSTATVGRARYSYARPFEVNTAATVRAVAEMTAVPRLLSVIPGGQSGHPLSAHYADQYPAWLAGELYPIAPRAPAASAGRLTLMPE